MAGRIAVVVSYVGRVLLALLAFLLAVEAPGAGSLRSVVYDYDGASSTPQLASHGAPQAATNQDVRGKSTSTASLRSGYDDRANSARALARPVGYGLAPRAASSIVDDTVRMADDWLGSNVRTITNRAGDKVFLSDDGLRRIRFDIRNPAPHTSPHAHVEEFVNGRWVKSGPIFPRDVPQR